MHNGDKRTKQSAASRLSKPQAVAKPHSSLAHMLVIGLIPVHVEPRRGRGYKLTPMQRTSYDWLYSEIFLIGTYLPMYVYVWSVLAWLAA